jgi:hypothetical protein
MSATVILRIERGMGRQLMRLEGPDRLKSAISARMPKHQSAIKFEKFQFPYVDGSTASTIDIIKSCGCKLKHFSALEVVQDGSRVKSIVLAFFFLSMVP